VAAQRPVRLSYDTGGQGDCRLRVVRPVAVEQRAGYWYLHAYCLERRADRVFRLDRIAAVSEAEERRWDSRDTPSPELLSAAAQAPPIR
jgi:predicted DNA-binding transcriptional regulator YafY